VGAAIQSSIMSGDMGKDVVLVDVTPLTLGVEVKGGLMEPLIERNTPIPVKKSKVFTTAEDRQTEVEVRVYQGERSMATQNHLLGSFRLVGITPAPRGVPQIEVEFDIDTDGIVHVKATDKGTGKEQSMVVTGRNKLNEEDINRMVDEAEQNKEKDEKKKKEIEMKNQADALVYSTEKMLKDNGDKLSDELRGKLESLKNDLREAINNDNVARIKSLMDELQQESMKAGEEVYKAQQENQAEQGQQQEQPAENTEQGPQDDNTVNADYEDVDENK